MRLTWVDRQTLGVCRPRDSRLRAFSRSGIRRRPRGWLQSKRHWTAIARHTRAPRVACCEHDSKSDHHPRLCRGTNARSPARNQPEKHHENATYHRRDHRRRARRCERQRFGGSRRGPIRPAVRPALSADARGRRPEARRGVREGRGARGRQGLDAPLQRRRRGQPGAAVGQRGLRGRRHRPAAHHLGQDHGRAERARDDQSRRDAAQAQHQRPQCDEARGLPRTPRTTRSRRPR